MLKISSLSKQEKFNYYKASFEIPMVILSLSLLGIIIILESFPLDTNIIDLLHIADNLIWLGFVIELLFLTYLAPSKIKYLKQHWYDILIVLIPLLRFTRLLRVTRIVDLEKTASIFQNLITSMFGTDAQLFRVFPLIVKALVSAKSMFLRHKLNYIILIIIGLVFFLGSLGAVFESKDVNGNITSIVDGLWWGIVSITTVGYGDKYPVTLPGRLIGVLLMTLGVITFSMLTANIASFLVEGKQDEEQAILLKKLGEMDEKVSRIIDDLEQHHGK